MSDFEDYFYDVNDRLGAREQDEQDEEAKKNAQWFHKTTGFRGAFAHSVVNMNAKVIAFTGYTDEEDSGDAYDYAEFITYSKQDMPKILDTLSAVSKYCESEASHDVNGLSERERGYRAACEDIMKEIRRGLGINSLSPKED